MQLINSNQLGYLQPYPPPDPDPEASFPSCREGAAVRQAGGRGRERAEVGNRDGAEVLRSILSYKFNKLEISLALNSLNIWDNRNIWLDGAFACHMGCHDSPSQPSFNDSLP